MITKQCAGCERSFEGGSNRAKWCPECKAGQVKASNGRYNAMRGGRTRVITVTLRPDKHTRKKPYPIVLTLPADIAESWTMDPDRFGAGRFDVAYTYLDDNL